MSLTTTIITFFLNFWRSPQLVVEVNLLCGVENLYSAQGECSDRVVLMVRHPRGCYIVYPLLSLEVATPQHKSNSFDAVIHVQESPPQRRFSRMQLTLHATRPTPRGTSRLVLAMSVGSVKTRRAPSRHCRNARVYGHTTTALHDMSTPHTHLQRL